MVTWYHPGPLHHGIIATGLARGRGGGISKPLLASPAQHIFFCNQELTNIRQNKTFTRVSLYGINNIVDNAY